MNLLSVQNITKKYHNKYVVNDVSFSLKENSCTALIGPNGAGKTTILRILAGTVKRTMGRVLLHESFTNKDRRSYIGYLPQHPVFYSWMTGLEFLVFTGQLAHLSKEVAQKRARYLLKKVNIHEAKHQRIGHYSGGMKQRLGIAQALIHRPKILLLDEPVSSLDPLGRREVLDLLKQLKTEIAILFSTHILTDADEVSDELLLLKQGEIVEQGTLEYLRKQYEPYSIQLEFYKEAKCFTKKLHTLPNIQSFKIHGNKIDLTVTNIPKAREQILSLAIEEKWPLSQFNISTASLEDMFMKVVK